MQSKTTLHSLFLFLLTGPAAAQLLDDGTHVFENDSMQLEVTLSSSGWTLEKATILDKVNGSRMSGGGEYRSSPGSGDDSGWYEFQSAECNHEFEVNTADESIRLSRYDCKNGSPAYEGILQAVVQSKGLPVVEAEQLNEGRFKDWGQKPMGESRDGPPESWVYGSMMCEGPRESSASSTLLSQGKASYQPKNVMDEDPTTVWVEGKPDFGVGEFLEVIMEPWSNGIYLLNGYQSSRTAWENNSRVKQMQVSVNGVVVCLVDLTDRMGVQHFELPSSALDLFATQAGEVVIRFTIMEIYPGLKWKDTAISEVWTCGG